MLTGAEGPQGQNACFLVLKRTGAGLRRINARTDFGTGEEITVTMDGDYGAPALSWALGLRHSSA